MSVTLWLSVTFVCALGAMSPGPSLAVVVKNTIGNDRAHGFATAWAHAAGIGFYALLTTFGLALVITRSRPVYIAVTVIGALYLLYLGAQALRSRASSGQAPPGVRMGLVAAAREGFFIALLNPKVAIFILAVFSQFLRPEMTASSHLILSATVTLVDGLWYSIVALLLTHGGWHQTLQRNAHRVDKATGVVLILVAAGGLARLYVG